MNSQTVRRPPNQRPARPNKNKKYVKQTARFEGKRDGKPLVFGWGGHLSHNQKIRLQRRATWASAVGIAIIIVAVLIGFWININIIIPGLAITTVNGHQIPQSLYRKMAAFKTIQAEEDLNGPHGIIAQRDNLKKQIDTQQTTVNTTTNQVSTLKSQIQKLPKGSSQLPSLNAQLAAAQAQLKSQQSQLASLNAQYSNYTSNLVPTAQNNFTQSQVGNDSATWLQNDELIREWLATQPSSVQAQVNPSSGQVSSAMNTYRASPPTGHTYNALLSQDGVSDADMQAMMTIKLRRDNMQSYLASLIVSPAYQVHARAMTIDTLSHAQSVLKQLNQGGDFGKLAQKNSVDANTSTVGGDLGWMARGQYAQTYTAATVENWMFDPSRHYNELSPIISENGTFHIVQILGIDPSRAIVSTTLQSLKQNALSNWLLQQEALSTTHIIPTNQTMMLDTMNLPPDLPASAPASPSNPSGVPGVPGVTNP